MKRQNSVFKEMTFDKKLEHIWEYYKLQIIVSLIVILFIGISVLQIASRMSPDANIMYTGANTLPAGSVDSLKSSVASVMTGDPNGDGKTAIDYTQFQLFGEAIDSSRYINGAVMQENLEGYNAEILAGDSMILLLDDYYYQNLVSDNAIMPIVEYLDTVPDNADDAYSFVLSDLDIYKLDGFSSLPGNTRVCLKVEKKIGGFKNESTEKLKKNNIEVFIDMISFVK